MGKNLGGKNGKTAVGKIARIAGGIFLALILLILVLAAALLILHASGKSSFADRRKTEESAEVSRTVEDYEYDPLTERYNGKIYRYNESLTNFLIIGVDRAELGAEEGIPGSGGQADVIILAVLDEKKRTVSLISVDRNTMASVETFDASGKSIGFSERQITYSYAYGDGKEKSCALTSQSVSELFYGIPIHAYYALQMQAVEKINDAVGGVKVTIPIDMSGIDESFTEGAQVTLLGSKASMFLRARSTLEDSSNEARLSRHKIYLTSLISAAKTAVKNDISLPVKLYGDIAPLCCTDLTMGEIVYLASLAPGLDVRYFSVSGSTDTSGTYDAFYPDYEKLYRLVLDIFYVCEDKP